MSPDDDGVRRKDDDASGGDADRAHPFDDCFVFGRSRSRATTAKTAPSKSLILNAGKCWT